MNNGLKIKAGVHSRQHNKMKLITTTKYSNSTNTEAGKEHQQLQVVVKCYHYLTTNTEKQNVKELVLIAMS